MNIIEAFRLKEDLYYSGGATDQMVEEAESTLGLSFAEEYKQYLLNFGCASADGHEFTGMTTSSRLNVVDVTNNERLKNNNIPNDLYVIEDVGIDKVITWQNAKGEVFQTIGDSAPEKINESMVDYLNS